MLAFAHSDIDNQFIHLLGDIATLLTLVAVSMCLYAVIARSYRKQARGSLAFLSIAIFAIVISFWNGGSLAIFLIASTVAFVFAVMALVHLFRPLNAMLPRTLRTA